MPVRARLKANPEISHGQSLLHIEMLMYTCTGKRLGEMHLHVGGTILCRLDSEGAWHQDRIVDFRKTRATTPWFSLSGAPKRRRREFTHIPDRTIRGT